MRAPLGQVGDPGSQALGVDRQADHVHGRFEQTWCDCVEQGVDRVVGADQVPTGVHDERGERQVRGQDPLESFGHLGHRRVGEQVLGVGGREPGGEETAVLVAQRHGQLVAQPHASSGPPRKRERSESFSWGERIIALVGRERPVSMKLTCRLATPARRARSSWERLRRLRQSRSRVPGSWSARLMPTTISAAGLGADYLGGNRRHDAGAVKWARQPDHRTRPPTG